MSITDQTGNSVSTDVSISQPRDDVRVQLPDNQMLAAPVGTTIETLLNFALDHNLMQVDSALIASVVNDSIRELNYTLNHDAAVTPITLSMSDGGRIYRRSLVLLLITAAHQLWPDVKIIVKYAITDGGYFCSVENREPLTGDDLTLLQQQMQMVVAADIPTKKRVVELDEAERLFRQRGESDKVRLLRFRQETTLTLYSFGGREDYFYGYMVASSGYLGTFRLVEANDGFILQYPRREVLGELQPITTYNKLSQVFSQADDWLERMKIDDIGSLNQVIHAGRIQELILIAEALHEQNVSQIATDIVSRVADGVRVVLIAGPSSAGKTTFSKRLAIQLLANGIRPFTLEMDNYFVDREDTPTDERGNYDFESLYALQLDRFNHDLDHLLRGERVQLPRFDFRAGQSLEGDYAQLMDNQIIVIEGIHGLNPELVHDLSADHFYRIYVSALTQLNIDRHNRVPTTDVRMLRRIVRDARTRGWNAADTLRLWPNVRHGEKKNIFPYQENADAIFNSALVYELAALKQLATPLLLQVPRGTSMHIEAHRLLSFLKWVLPLSPEQIALVPDTSILSEFIGGSVLDDYHPSLPFLENEPPIDDKLGTLHETLESLKSTE